MFFDVYVFKCQHYSTRCGQNVTTIQIPNIKYMEKFCFITSILKNLFLIYQRKKNNREGKSYVILNKIQNGRQKEAKEIISESESDVTTQNKRVRNKYLELSVEKKKVTLHIVPGIVET